MTVLRLGTRRETTPGVRVRAGRAEHPELACAAPVGSPEALELGLVSHRLVVRVGAGPGGRTVTLPPWFTSHAAALPPGFAALGTTLRHQASGMAPLLAAAVALLAVGATTASLGLVGVAALAVLVLGTVLLHELGHVAAYRVLFGPTAPALVVVRGAACHIVRRADDSRSDAAVVIAGGAAPALLAVIALPFAAVAPYPVAVLGLVALGHVAALALPFGDGDSLRRIAAERRRRRNDAARVTVVAASTTRRSRPRAGSSRRARSPGTAGRSAGA